MRKQGESQVGQRLQRIISGWGGYGAGGGGSLSYERLTP